MRRSEPRPFTGAGRGGALEARSAVTDPSELALLSRLWLHEPAEPDLERARGFGWAVDGSVAELAERHARVLLLGVPPYGSLFTDPHGELAGAASLARSWTRRGYAPAELGGVAAADHFGLALGSLAFSGAAAARDPELRREHGAVAGRAPLCCAAVAREPGAGSFFRDLALRSLAAALGPGLVSPAPGEAPPPPPLDDAETTLLDRADYFLTPARCGADLSRARLGTLARTLGLEVPFGPRREVAVGILRAAGEGGAMAAWCAALDGELAAWSDFHGTTAGDYAGWGPAGKVYGERVAQARALATEIAALAAGSAARS